MRATVLLPRSHAYRTLPTAVATLLVSALSAAAAYGQPAKAGTALPVLTQVSQIRQLTRQQAARGYPVRIRAAVTYSDPAHGDLFVQDSTAGIWGNVPHSAPPLAAGQLVEMEGVTEIPDFAPQIGNPRYRVVGTAPLPRARHVSLERMLSTAEDSQWVETQGVVRRVERQQGLLTIDVAVPGGRLRALVPDDHTPASHELGHAAPISIANCNWWEYCSMCPACNKSKY